MSILVNKKTRVLIQGITGSEGSRVCRDMRAYGTVVLAGVTPGKGGENVDGVPVFATVAAAKGAHPSVNCSLIVVPARFVKAAAIEAITARIPLVVILTENVAVRDSAYLIALARKKKVRVLGPSSIGIIVPGHVKVGAVGVGAMARAYAPGPIGLMSKSGGMTSEIAFALTRAGFGQSTALGVGGDTLTGLDFVDLYALFERDSETRAVVFFGEVGGTAEERVAEYRSTLKNPKPLIALIAGRFSALLPGGTTLGHAGAIVSEGRGSYASKVRALKASGVHIAHSVEEIPTILAKALKKYEMEHRN